MKQTLILLACLIATNLLCAFLIVPYAQGTANSHINIGPNLGYVFYFTALIVALITIIKFWKQHSMLLFLFAIALSLVMWAYKLQHLYCMGCANSG
ncbi:hypothetical protein ACLI09_00360 [Flavobacterium sp. RHBU_24]|uniref:hypothetical protein n=1 Tax=Flavobacterium sp. RHBU_24 TaxID=3391185 RepID=UPI0039846EF4